MMAGARLEMWIVGSFHFFSLKSASTVNLCPHGLKLVVLVPVMPGYGLHDEFALR